MVEIDVDRALTITEKVSNVIGILLSMFLTIQLLGDLLGIKVTELLKMAVTKPWVIPTEWIEMYYPVWYGMEWALLILMLFDNVYTMRYLQIKNAPPPPAYERWMSFAIFMISFWLALIFRYTSLTMITIFAAISFSYTMFIRKE